MNEHLIKGLSAFAASGTIAIIETLEKLPAFLQQVGLPVAFLICVLYALACIHKQLRDTVSARFEDSAHYSERLAKHIEEGATARAKLIELSEKSLELNSEQLKAQAHTAIAIEKLVENLKSRPCQK